MMHTLKHIGEFLRRILHLTFEGGWRFNTWMIFLFLISLVGLNAYMRQYVEGLQTTGLTDQVAWGAYIANFTFMDGVAAAMVLLAFPAFLHKNEAMKDVALLGLLLGTASVIMCLLFIMVDLGRPERFLHLVPPFGIMNFPGSVLSWDVLVLNGYFIFLFYLCFYLLFSRYMGKEPKGIFFHPAVLICILFAVGLQTVNAFLLVGLAGRPFWNHPIVAPRFLASAFAVGPSLLIIMFQMIRGFADYKISNRTIFWLRRIVRISLGANLFLLFCELFAEFYTTSYHSVSTKYLYFGLHGANELVPWIWSAMGLNVLAFILLISPWSKYLAVLNVSSVMLIVGIWIEKGMGLIIPGFVPTPLGEIVEYGPSMDETIVCFGVWAFGALVFSWMVRISVPILTGRLAHSDITADKAST